MAIQEREFEVCHGVSTTRIGHLDCEEDYESTILLVRVLADLQRPDVENVIRIPGPIRRHLIQDDDSILIESRDAIWLLMPSGKEIKRIADRKDFDGAPRSLLLTEKGSALLLTTLGLWRIDTISGQVTKVSDIDTSYTYPHQRFVPIHVSGKGDIYLGLTYFLVRLAMDGENYSAEWYVPADCPLVRVRRPDVCFCVGEKGRSLCRDCSQIGAILTR